MMNDTGILEIGGKRAEVARKDIRRLKLILDELGITHIIDDITFFDPLEQGRRKKGNFNIMKLKAENCGKLSREIVFGRRVDFEFREMIIPYIFNIDYLSLTQLDYEEAEFLGYLLYGAE